MPKGQPRAKVETLLRILIREAKSERVRLKAIELLMECEGKRTTPKATGANSKANPSQLQSKSKDSDGSQLAKLALQVASESPAS